MEKTIGVIINPLAGLGGQAGLKGSDGPDIVALALARGAQPQASHRAMLALEQLSEAEPLPRILTYGGEMGQAQLAQLGLPAEVVGYPAGEVSCAEDTIEAARRMQEAGCQLLLFTGGDGTARNICAAIGSGLPVIGIPAGVKIHSAVYAVNPRRAGQAVLRWLRGEVSRYQQAAVMDIDEELFRQGRVEARRYGLMTTPVLEDMLQGSKNGAAAEEDELEGMAQYVADQMQPDTLYIIGPGSTTKAIMDELELPDTLLGVDVVKNGQLLAADVSEARLWQLLTAESGPIVIIVTIIGGQGNLFGRGNQQLSPRILRRVGKKQLWVVSSSSKLLALEGKPLRVDTGDLRLDQELSGYLEVIVGYAQTSLTKVSD